MHFNKNFNPIKKKNVNYANAKAVWVDGLAGFKQF